MLTKIYGKTDLQSKSNDASREIKGRTGHQACAAETPTVQLVFFPHIEKEDLYGSVEKICSGWCCVLCTSFHICKLLGLVFSKADGVAGNNHRYSHVGED